MKPYLKTLLIIFLIVFLYPAEAQAWFKHYGGVNWEYGKSIQQTSDGGYIVAGYSNTYTHGNDDVAIYKLTSSGNKIWYRHYGGSSDDGGASIVQTSDGGYIVAGSTSSFTHGSADFAIYRLNSSGNKVWFKHYGGSNTDVAFSIQQTSDGGYVAAGYTTSFTFGGQDFAIYRLNSSGAKIWFKHYGGTENDRANAIQQTSDGGYIVAGETHSYTYGGNDFAIYRLDSSGNKVWFKHYGGSSAETAYSIQQTTDGGYIVAGSTYTYTYGTYDFAIYKLNSDGNKIWFKHYGGTDWDEAFSIQQISGGGYIVAGYSQSYTHGSYDFGIYKLDSSGNKLWFKHYGGSGDDRAHSIQLTSDGGYITAGRTDSYTYGNLDFAIYKLDSKGDK